MISARQRSVVVATLCVCHLLLCGALYVLKPPNPDHGIFDYIGWIGSLGGRYYVDVAEQNFPGEMLLHEAAIRLFGPKFWAYRALDFGLLMTGAAALGALLYRGGLGFGALLGSAFYVAGYVSSNGWMAGQRDVVAANLLLVVGWLFIERMRGGGRRWIVAIGPLLFFSLLLRPTYVLFAAAVPVVDWWRCPAGRHYKTRLTDTTLVGLAVAVCAGASLGWAVMVGSWSDFRQQALLFNVQAYSAGHSHVDTLTKLSIVLSGYWCFLPAVAMSMLYSVRRERWNAPLLIVIGLGGVGITSAIIQNKGFGYHLGALLPGLFGLAGAGMWIPIEAILLRQHSGWKLKIFQGIAAALLLLGLVRQLKSLGPQIRYLAGMEPLSAMMAREGGGQAGLTWADMFAAADYVKATTKAEDTIIVWGRPVSIHLLSQRRSATRFITYGMLVLARAPFEGAAEWIGEFDDALSKRAPRIVFVPVTGEQTEFGEIGPGDQRCAAIDSLREAIAKRYERMQDFGSLRAYRLRD